VDQESFLFHRDLFAVTDTNGDGKITFNEWRDSAVRSTSNNENNATLFETWANYDTANIGYLTEDEAVNRRA
jgi:Ca2+-binding EF-hand superfamily protein